VETDIIHKPLEWLSDIWLPILIIILVATFAEMVSEKMVKFFIRRAVHGKHLGRPQQPISDIKKRQDTIISLAVVSLKVAIFLIAAFAIFVTIFPRANFLPFFASAGVVGAIIGFGAQSIIKDLLAGIFIIAENQVRVGDIVDIEGASGTVEHITLRSTVLRDVSGNVHYLANGSIFHVINKTMGFSKVNFVLAVEPKTDIDKLSTIIDSVGKKLATAENWKEKITEAPHFVNLGAFSNTALEVNISGNTTPGDQWAVTSEMKKRLLRELQKHDDIILSQYQDLTGIAAKK
jgi:small conductance mechanosensitive channel